MNKLNVGIVIVMARLLFASLSYGQELSGWERQIFYDAAEWELTNYEYFLSFDTSDEELNALTQKFLNQKGITEEQLDDIMERGLKIPLTAIEEQLADEIKKNITENLTPDEIVTVCEKLAYEYDVSLGQAATILARTAEELE